MHMAAAKLGCKMTMFGTKWAYSNPGYMNRHRKRYSHLVGALFLAGKARNAVVNEWAW